MEQEFYKKCDNCFNGMKFTRTRKGLKSKLCSKCNGKGKVRIDKSK